MPGIKGITQNVEKMNSDTQQTCKITQRTILCSRLSMAELLLL